jgi:DNA-binding SARP family transcriptional activator
VLLVAAPAPGLTAEPMSEEQRFIEMMNGYLNVSQQWVELAGKRAAVIFFAVEGIVEIYEERGEIRAAIPHLERLLAEHGGDPAMRAIVSFKLRDVYKKTGQQEKALAILEDVIARTAAR